MKNKRKGLSLVEIIVATMIMAITMAGLVNLFVSSKRWLLHSRARMTGGELGKLFLDPSYSDIQQLNWDDSSNDYLSGNSLHKRNEAAGTVVTLDNRGYQPYYTLESIPGFGVNEAARKLKVRIYWDEPD